MIKKHLKLQTPGPVLYIYINCTINWGIWVCSILSYYLKYNLCNTVKHAHLRSLVCANWDHVCLWGTYQAARWGLLTNTHTISMASFACTTSALAHDMALHNVLLTRYKRFDSVSPLHKHMLYCSVSPLNGNFIQLSVAVCPHNYFLILL